MNMGVASGPNSPRSGEENSWRIGVVLWSLLSRFSLGPPHLASLLRHGHDVLLVHGVDAGPELLVRALEVVCAIVRRLDFAILLFLNSEVPMCEFSNH